MTTTDVQVQVRLLDGPQGVRLFTQEVTAATGAQKPQPTVLFTPGWLQSARAFEQQFPLAEHGYRLVLWDLPLQGRSVPYTDVASPFSLSPTLYAESLRTVLWMYHAFEEPVTMVVWSFGGIVLRYYLARYGLDGINHVIFVGSGIDIRDIQPYLDPETLTLPQRLQSSHRLEQWRALIELVDKLTACPVAITLADLLFAENLRSLCQVSAYTVPGALSPLLKQEGQNGERIVSLLRAIPTVILQGKRDPLVPEPFAREVLVPQLATQLQGHPACGHAPHIEDPAWFNQQVLAFLSER